MSRQRSHIQRDHFKKALEVDEEIDAVAPKVVMRWLAVLIPLVILIAIVIVQQQADPGEGERKARLLAGAAAAGVIFAMTSTAWWRIVRSPEQWQTQRVIRQRAAQARRYLDVAIGSSLAAVGLVLSALFQGYVMELLIALGPLAVVLGIRGPADRWSRALLIARRDARVPFVRDSTMGKALS